MNGTNRADITKELLVAIIEKQNQRNGKLTEGNVQDILTNSSFHPHGIKVRLSSGKIGRVAAILSKKPALEKGLNNHSRVNDTK